MAMLCATFPTVPVVALTATANRKDIEAIRDSLNLKNPLEVIGIQIVQASCTRKFSIKEMM